MRHNIFISGHSLTDRPMPDFLTELANGAGAPLWWNMQNIAGSSIKQRSYGTGAGSWSGFAGGTDRDANPIDVRTELRMPSTPDGKPYDILMITEQHRLLDALLWQDTSRYLKVFQDEFIASNARGRTYFYAPWIDLTDKTNPSEWIEYERKALPIWRCMVARVNDDLARSGRQDRIHFLPASLALAELVNHLVSQTTPGFEWLDTTARVDAVLFDDVHPTRLGAYYLAAVAFFSIYDADPTPVGVPAMIDSRQASTVKAFAVQFVENYRAQSLTLRKADCLSPITFAFILHYTSYIDHAYDRKGGILTAWLRRLRNTLRFIWHFKSAPDVY
jgi:hypothetical protein